MFFFYYLFVTDQSEVRLKVMGLGGSGEEKMEESGRLVQCH